MSGLLKTALALALLGGLGYGFFYVPLGSKTFYQHLLSIAETREAKTLGTEMEKKYQQTEQRIKTEIKSTISNLAESNARDSKNKASAPRAVDQASGSKPDADVPADISEQDRQALKQLFRRKIGKNATEKRE